MINYLPVYLTNLNRHCLFLQISVELRGAQKSAEERVLRSRHMGEKNKRRILHPRRLLKQERCFPSICSSTIHSFQTQRLKLFPSVRHDEEKNRCSRPTHYMSRRIWETFLSQAAKTLERDVLKSKSSPLTTRSVCKIDNSKQIGLKSQKESYMTMKM